MVTILSVVIFYGVKKINTRSENMKDNWEENERFGGEESMKIKTPEERDASDGQRETSEARKRLFQSEKITTISKPSVDSLTLWSGINKKKKMWLAFAKPVVRPQYWTGLM